LQFKASHTLKNRKSKDAKSIVGYDVVTYFSQSNLKEGTAEFKSQDIDLFGTSTLRIKKGFLISIPKSSYSATTHIVPSDLQESIRLKLIPQHRILLIVNII